MDLAHPRGELTEMGYFDLRGWVDGRVLVRISTYPLQTPQIYIPLTHPLLSIFIRNKSLLGYRAPGFV